MLPSSSRARKRAPTFTIAQGSHLMNAVRRAFPIQALAALHVAAAISTSLARAEPVLSAAEWHSGGRGIHAYAASLATPDWEVPASPLLSDTVTPKETIGAPGECKIEITFRKDRRAKTHGVRRHSMNFSHRAGAPSRRPQTCPLPGLTVKPKG